MRARKKGAPATILYDVVYYETGSSVRKLTQLIIGALDGTLLRHVANRKTSNSRLGHRCRYALILFDVLDNRLTCS